MSPATPSAVRRPGRRGLLLEDGLRLALPQRGCAASAAAPGMAVILGLDDAAAGIVADAAGDVWMAT